MNAPDRRWSRVEALYHEMLSRPPNERAAALAAACHDDPGLATEVQSLLDQPGSAGGFLVTPALEVVARVVSGTRASLTGQRVGAFEVQNLLAVGGMGEVYRARDTKLGRDVAIKVLPEAFAHDHARLARFNREAQALASINHPNIAVIHGIEEIPAASGSGPGSRALVMELVEGEDLSARISRGPLPASEALPIARQIAKALQAAHEHGIVHRDLKPANIKVRADGTVKVLDFGLAKVQPIADVESRAGSFNAPTGDGAVMGTPGYMSPEQIRGQQVDWRSDLFAFGIVLYEMLTGRRAFAKGSDVETLHAALTEAPPDLSTIAPNTDPTLAAIVARCIEKLPENRFRSAKALGFALEALDVRSRLQTSMLPRRPDWRLAAAAALALGLTTLGLQLSRNSPLIEPATFHQVTSDGRSMTADLSPDGERIAYVSSDSRGRRLMVRDLSGGSPVEVYRSEQEPLATLRWSHSGTHIAVKAGPTQVIVVSRFGGPPVRIGGLGSVFRISWSLDDSELILGSVGARWFWVASIKTLEVRRLEMDAPFLRGFGGFVTDVSPDGERLLFFVTIRPHGGVWSMKRDGTNLRKLSSETRRVLDARWAPDGASFYYLLLGANASEVRRARALADGPDPSPSVVQGNVTVQDSLAATMTISRNGKLAYPRASLDRSLWQADVSASLSSQEPIPLRGLISGPRSDYPRISPDRTQLVYARQDGELGQVWLASASGENQTSVMSRKGTAGEPVWSPDGRNIAYWFDDDDGPVLHVASVRSGADRALKRVDLPSYLEWGPGSRLIYRAEGSWTYTLTDPVSGEERSLTDAEDGTSHYSPRYSNRGDRVALYYNARTRRGVVGLATVSLRDRRVRMITDTPALLRPIGWSADDALVYAVDEGSSHLVAVRVDGGEVRTMGRLPSRRTLGDAVETNGRLRLVLGYPDDRSDIWVIDNFDGGRR